MYKRIIDSRWDFTTANTKEYTHCYHTYPAMMIPQVARTLIEKYAPTDKCGLLFDPYMGSGTSLVEASLKRIDSIGTDINPLARMISESKVTHFPEDAIAEINSNLFTYFWNYSPDKVRDNNFSRISNYTFWYSEDALYRLSYISQFIDEIRPDCQLFFKIALSEVVREVSFTRNGEFKRFKMSEASLKKFSPDVFGLFESKVSRNLKGLTDYNVVANGTNKRICSFNSVYGIPEDILPKESVDIVVTSPPYGDSRTTVAYGQFSRWANEWFDFPDAKNLDNLLMGGKKQTEKKFKTESIAKELAQIEELDKTRHLEVISFLNDYSASMKNVAPVVRKGGRICYVVGNRTVKGIQIPLDYFTAEIFEQNGFKHDITIVRNIPSKRMPAETSPTNKTGEKVSTMTNEFMVVMTKI
ncbi:MAG: DNA methyltransferase [Bacteroidales bacterium]|nr:DNA methyltransferase [Bacteroidales bacterium]